MEDEKLKLVGYHGCDKAKTESILRNNFSIGDVPGAQLGTKLWLGRGVYFFGAGISNPVLDAENWAKFKAYIKGSTHVHYKEFVVLRAIICPKKLLDASTDTGKAIINRARDRVRERLSEVILKGDDYEDPHIINFLVKQMRFDVFIADLCTRFVVESVSNIRTRLPNTRVICVILPESCIDKSTIAVVKHGPTKAS